MANYQPNPQYPQNPQYGGYPPPPPPPRRSNTGIIAFGVAVVLIVLGSGIFVVTRFTGDTAGVSTAPSPGRATDDPSAGVPSTAGSPEAQPSQPVPSAQPSQPVASKPPVAACNGCFPGLTVNGLVKQLATKGFTCKEDRVLGIECAKNLLEIDIDRDYKLKNQVESIDVTGRATSKGEYPQGPSVAYARLKAGLPGVLPMFITDAAVRQQIVAFSNKNTAHAATGPAAVRDGKAGGFRLSCQGVHGFTVRGKGRSASSYSTSVTMYGPSAY